MKKCECEKPGLCNRHGIEKNDELFNLCQKSSVVFDLWERGIGPGQKSDGKVIETVTENVIVRYDSPANSHKKGPGSLLHERFKEMGVPVCQSCNSLSKRMDAWGPDGCEQHMDIIVDEIHARAKQWLSQSKKWVDKLKANAPDFAQKIVIKSYVEKAIKESRGS